MAARRRPPREYTDLDASSEPTSHAPPAAAAAAAAVAGRDAGTALEKEEALRRRVPADLAKWLAALGHVELAEGTDFGDRRDNLLYNNPEDHTKTYSKLRGHAVAGGGVEGYVLYVSPHDMPNSAPNTMGRGGRRLEHALKIRELHNVCAVQTTTTSAQVDPAVQAVRNEAQLTAREILQSWVLNALQAPYVASLLRWSLCAQLTRPAVIQEGQWPIMYGPDDHRPMFVAERINELLGRNVTSADASMEQLTKWNAKLAFDITDYFQPPSTGYEARLKYLHANNVPGLPPPPDERAHNVGALTAQYHQDISERYALERASLIRRYAEMGRKQRPVLLLEQQYAGNQSAARYLLSIRSLNDAHASWFHPDQWAYFRGHYCVLAHQLYTLQALYGFVHGDLHPGNIGLMDLRAREPSIASSDAQRNFRVPKEYSGLWLPNSDGLLLDLDARRDLGALLPRLIDFGRATVDASSDYGARVRTLLALDPANGEEKALSDDATGYLYGKSRVQDLRRMALLSTYGLLNTLRALFVKDSAATLLYWRQTLLPQLRRRGAWEDGGGGGSSKRLTEGGNDAPVDRDNIASLRTNAERRRVCFLLQAFIEPRVVMVLLGLISLPAEWYRAVKDAGNGIPLPVRGGYNKSSSMASFLRRMACVQTVLNALLRVLQTPESDFLKIPEQRLALLCDKNALSNTLQMACDVKDDLGAVSRIMDDELQQRWNKPRAVGVNSRGAVTYMSRAEQQHQLQQQYGGGGGGAFNQSPFMPATNQEAMSRSPFLTRLPWEIGDPRLPESFLRWDVLHGPLGSAQSSSSGAGAAPAFGRA